MHTHSHTHSHMHTHQHTHMHTHTCVVYWHIHLQAMTWCIDRLDLLDIIVLHTLSYIMLTSQIWLYYRCYCSIFSWICHVTWLIKRKTRLASPFQCVAACCSVLHCVAVCCSLMQCVALPVCHDLIKRNARLCIVKRALCFVKKGLCVASLPHRYSCVTCVPWLDQTKDLTCFSLVDCMETERGFRARERKRKRESEKERER